MEYVIDFVIKISPAFVAAFLAAWWSSKKFLSEKNWERREKAYEEIVNALYDLIVYFRVQKEDYGQGTGLSSDAESRLYQKYISASSALGKATDIGSFYISYDASEILNDLRKREQLDYNSEPKFDFFEHEYINHREALDELLKVARSDLQISRT